MAGHYTQELRSRKERLQRQIGIPGYVTPAPRLLPPTWKCHVLKLTTCPLQANEFLSSRVQLPSSTHRHPHLHPQTRMIASHSVIPPSKVFQSSKQSTSQTCYLSKGWDNFHGHTALTRSRDGSQEMYILPYIAFTTFHHRN